MRQIDVVAAVIPDNQGQILIGQRGPDDHPPLKWEFPGGKIETGETPQQAVVREIFEEFELQISADEILGELDYTYADRALQIHFYLILCHCVATVDFKHLHAHMDYQWKNPAEFHAVDFAPADVEMLCIFNEWRKHE